MDPYTEQILRNEVIYLHSLWHQGPNPQPINLHPSNPPRFKKPHKKNPKPNHIKKTGPKFSGKEWPVKPPPADPPLTPSGWPELKLKPKPQPTRLPTEQELENIKWNNIQQQAINVTKEFYLNNDEISDEDNDDELDSDDENDIIINNNNDDDVEHMVEGFVVKLFDEVEGLREYYLKYCGGGGEFVCLICGGVGEKCGKRFKDCVALVQHSVAIAKTKKRRSHRAFGKVVCKVLGWEIDRLPVSSVLEQKCNGLEGGDGNVGKDVNDLNGVVDGANSVGRTSDGAEGVEGECESMVCEDITTVANEEHNKNQVLNEAEGCTGGAVNNLCRNMSPTMVLEQVPCDQQTN